MYSEWASLSAQITANSCGAQCFSVLNKFPASAGREVVVSVVKQLGTNLGITQNAEPSHLVKDEEVKWCMDVICFGLSLPLQEHETIKDCVNVYCEWLTALHPQPRISVPKPICEDANLYARQIINHFHNLFVPRQGEILPFLYQTTLGADTIKRQAVLCHRVLRTLQQTAQISQLMDRQTWDTLLLFLLAINEILLAPPTVKDDVGDQLCERVLSVLFEVWLLACVRSFPSPSMWKTLQESCAMWRHRVALVDQWNRVNLALTARLLEFSYGPAFPQLKNADEDNQLIPIGMSNDCVAQTWYRFLRMIGNPTALCSPHLISKSSHFVQWALTHEKGAETHQHPCLQQLPQIFLNAMKGISSQVDAFLGVYQPPPQQSDGVVTNLLEIRHSLNEATSTTLQQFIHSSSATNIANQHQANQHHHHHLHYPHLHLHGAGSFLRDNFMSNSASSALNAIMGHHGGGHHHHHHHHNHNQQQQQQQLQISASPTSNQMSTTGGSAVGSTSAGGSHSAGVVGSISFGNTTESSGIGPAASATPTPPLQRRLAKSFSVAPTITQQKGLSKTSLIGLTGGGARNAIISSSSSSSTTTNTSSTAAASGGTTGGVSSSSSSSTFSSTTAIGGSGGGGGGGGAGIPAGPGIPGSTGAGTGSGSAPAPAPTTPTSTSGPPSASSSINSLPLTSMGAGVELAVARPKCNSILHVFHEWLFEAAHIGGDTWRQNRKKQACEASKRPSSMIMEHRKGSISLSQPNSLNDPQSLPPTLTIDKYESGRAEAIGTLCKIFCAKKTGEEILPVYLARFYMALQQCLKITESRECDETLASILLHSSDLFRLDLDGINVLLPGFIAALEIVLPDKDLKLKTQSMVFNRTELRRSAINILLSIMVLPLHYQTLPIRDLTSETSEKMYTFIQLKSRLMNILMNALQVETDAQNTHMLLGGLLLCVQDAVTFEETELGGGNASLSHNSSGVQHHEANLLSSACSERSASLVSAGTASLGGQTTATMGAGSGSIRDTASAHDYPSLTISDDMSFEFGQELEGVTTYDNAHALFVRATYLVCHRLISSWKTDLNVSLAALELLSGLARLHIRETDALECKRAVKWICDYICYQCSRPPPAHSKDLHSTIVAAFQCTAAWLMQHPYLLQDKDCLQTVLEVVELGISGTKSQTKGTDIPKFKDEKELKPASMRVRDAAENLLTIILEQVGYFPSECGPESISSLLDELALMKHCNSMVPAAAASSEQAIAKFKYFVTENSTILALLEEPLGNDQDPQPTVTLLIRGPFGRHAWTMQLRHLPRSKSGIKYHAVNPGRPIPMNDVTQRPECEQKNFPDGVDKVQPCVADYSIPTIEQMREQYGAASIRELEAMLETQSIHEKLAWAEADTSADSLSHGQECVPPAVCHEFHAARLFLSHFGFLGFETRNPHNPAEALGNPPQRPLIVLDTKSTAFAADLERLDKLSARTHDTVYVFYVKSGQTSAQQIIGNMSEEQSAGHDPHFASMLQTLGWPVQVTEHSGWTGFAHNSWSLKGTPEEQQLKINTAANELNYNGSQRVLYWADVSSEIAFVVPTTWNLRHNSDTGGDGASISSADQIGTSNVWARGEADGMSGLAKSKSRNLSLELDTHNRREPGAKEPVPPTRRKGNVTKPTLLAQAPAKIFLVWLESYEDYLNFPLEDVLAYTRTGEELHTLQLPRATDCHVIFVHSLLSGLLRVKLQGPPGRMSFATPLVDGMVLSRRVVGNLVRQTALNISRRRRLDNDNYQPPHVRRRLKVQDIVQKYKMDLSEAELLAHLFQRAI
ncbi:ral GTPase-activating protein subunit beta isoform X4 [Drosophila elegans]|uniref:ral GTPase-activating protein subunit beta isoform X4 n=1 Tax=Drosophila elegans TaxID=30023 RepID=UPI0007E5D035|nr:ral GTPase-activating protein subunit beta isoform X4 [Drosophila elegans]